MVYLFSHGFSRTGDSSAHPPVFSLCGGHEKEGVRHQRQARLWCKCNDSCTSQSHSLVFGVLSVISRRWPLLSTPPHFDMQGHSLPLRELFSRKEWRFSQPTSWCSRPLRYSTLLWFQTKRFNNRRTVLYYYLHAFTSKLSILFYFTTILNTSFYIFLREYSLCA